ncbi:GHKL domain-containing protein [Duganella sp. FT92W]|uniref:histidine kinase n=1 Tax=Pseudoduganella rivuli TaxID=2666085 RepID=A0A7X2IPA9_9BURK|nr:DAHL domain-containing protein [Pseudoduganella rivuli]MRV73524.1 GHKL domain-containing protein [Pseudoduganella rivuli]
MSRHWQVGVCVAAALAAALVYVLLQAPDYDEPAYFEDVAQLQKIRQLDAQWELDVMKVRLGLLHGYDALVLPLEDMARLPSLLHARPGNAALAPAVDAYRRELDGKAALVESFKSRNAVFRNSLRYMIAMTDEAEAHVQHAGARQADVARAALDMREVSLETLEYIDLGENKDLEELELRLADLTKIRSDVGQAVRALAENFDTHVRIVLREHKAVDRLLADITAAPTDLRVDQINAVLASELQRASGRVRQHRIYLLALSVALSGLLLYAAGCLLRSHAIINRYNARLQQANDTLERRVSERTQQLEEAQSQLVAAAREAGKAEIATNVLHNVGNVLNSVSVSATLLQQQIKASRGGGLDMAVALMREHGDGLGRFLDDDERGRCLPGYLEGLALVLRTERETMTAEVAQLNGCVDHVKEIVAAQQAHAGSACMFEQCSVDEVLEQAVSMSAVSLARHGITIIQDVAALPPVSMDRHRVLQILVNLISNARRATERVPERTPRIVLRLRAVDGEMLRIDVVDNGEGILPENLARIFSHGFTTHKDGHGFGLHSCILAAREMGGGLRVHSDGAGRGATFTLELPTRQEERHALAA